MTSDAAKIYEELFQGWNDLLAEHAPTDNPLYRIWTSFGFVREFGGWREKMRSPDEWRKNPTKAGLECGANLMKRDYLVHRYAWAVPSPQAIKWIAERCPRIVEIGAGRGYWAKLLAGAGVDILAFDIAGNGDRIGRNATEAIRCC